MRRGYLLGKFNSGIVLHRSFLGASEKGSKWLLDPSGNRDEGLDKLQRPRCLTSVHEHS